LEAQAELNQARVKCISDFAHSAALIQSIFRQLEVRVIEQVKKLCAELHSSALLEGILQNGKVLVDEVRTDQSVAPYAAHTPSSWKGKD
jgi:hypothetical protein